MLIAKQWIILGIILWSMTACTQAIYGVPTEKWEKMTETERQTIIERFKQQEVINERTRKRAEIIKYQGDKAREEAKEFERKCRENGTMTAEKCRVITRRKFGF